MPISISMKTLRKPMLRITSAKVRKLLKQQGMSVSMLAKSIKSNPQHVQRVLDGRIPCGASLAIKIEKKLDKKVLASELMRIL